MERNYFTFGGYDSRDFGIYISGSGTFNIPERDYDTAIVPGRNGALLMTMSRIDNIELEYPAYIYSDFSDRIAAMRSAFMGLEGYQRLTDSYHPDEYRLAYFEGDIKVKTTKRLDAGSFTLTFVCKPQRYLVDGEQPVELGQWGETTTVEGDVVTFDAPDGTSIKSLTASIEPVQAGSGDPSPSNVRAITGFTEVNVTVSPTQDAQDGTTYAVSFGTAGTVYGGTVDVVSGELTVTHTLLTLNGSEVYWSGVATSSGVLRAYTTPFFNGRDITHCDSLKVIVATTTVGTIGIASGRLIMTPSWAQSAANISAFKTLLASNPVTVVISLATPLTYNLTPAQITTLLGSNNVWADTGDVSVEYGQDPFAMVNPTQQTAHPILRVYGYGTLVVGSTTITIASHANAYIDIDCEVMDCHCGAVNCNSLVTFSTHEFPTFPAGVTHVSYSGNITKVEVEPNWWRA